MHTDANANTDPGGSTIALGERCSGELKRTEPAFLKPCPKVTKVSLIAIELKLSWVQLV